MIKIITALIIISTTGMVKAQEVPLNPYEMLDRNYDDIADLIPQLDTEYPTAYSLPIAFDKIHPQQATQEAMPPLSIRLPRSAISALANMHKSSAKTLQKGMKRAKVTRKKYACQVCQFVTNKLSDFIKHNDSKAHRAATGEHRFKWHEYTYTCQACKFGTNGLSNFIIHNDSKAHRAAISGPQLTWDEHTYTCQTCQYGTNQRIDLARHNNSKAHRDATGEHQLSWNEYTYICDTCQYGTHVLSKFNLHTATNRHKKRIDQLASIQDSGAVDTN